ncbi:PTS system mannose/fructose/sorbose family transporter subunit IID [Caproiciproducens sp.]|uniref:PTS system mannose/fructose/sorbose family transporter subunit IID n=1 Tax=Caproiciproducens sp. TaxID=1954376 RepID=UPI00289DF73A|nr:PTS system mannose/fructose/sorbose family transporter subunit IID [Caproiciproducens sp.]
MNNLTTVQPETLKEPVEKKTSKLEKKDITKAMWIYYLGAELSNSYERLQSLIFCASMTPVLKKLYNTDEELSKALKRHLVFFNTEGTFGAVIQGITILMEEEKAKGEDVTDDAITGLKTGLMGPIAGIGDAIIWAALMPILISIFLPFASNGSPMGGLLPLILYPLITIGVAYVLIHQGYTLGKKSVISLLNGGKMQSIIFSANVIGLTMMGALSASYVKLSTPVTFAFSSGNKIVLQDILNLIVPGLLPLLAVFLIYFYLKKRGPRYNLILATIVVISVVTAFLGIF